MTKAQSSKAPAPGTSANVAGMSPAVHDSAVTSISEYLCIKSAVRPTAFIPVPRVPVVGCSQQVLCHTLELPCGDSYTRHTAHLAYPMSLTISAIWWGFALLALGAVVLAPIGEYLTRRYVAADPWNPT